MPTYLEPRTTNLRSVTPRRLRFDYSYNRVSDPYRNFSPPPDHLTLVRG